MSAFLPISPLPRRFPHHIVHRQRLACAQTWRACARSQSSITDAVVARLREELPNAFDASRTPDYSLYSPSVSFEDPLNKFSGTRRYAQNISFLMSSFVFLNATIALHDLAVLPTRQDTVRSRWTLSMRVNLPWRPTISFTGTSDYVVDSNGLIVRHVDYWDSLQDSAFFSLPAVLNVILQCRPSTVAPTDLGGFELLRRTATFDIRRFKDVRIVKEADAWVIAPITSEDYVELTSIAAVSLTALPSQSEMMHLEKELRGQLVGASFAQPASRCFYVRLCLRDITVHEFWLELSSANARLDL